MNTHLAATNESRNPGSGAARGGTMCRSKASKLSAVIVLLLTAAAPASGATNYAINFTTSSGSPAPLSGSFTYDSTTAVFTNFLVTWNGHTYDLTAAANHVTLGGSGCAGEASTP